MIIEEDVTSLPSKLSNVIQEIVSIDRDDIFQDMRSKGLMVNSLNDIRSAEVYKHYHVIEGLMKSYAGIAARNSAVTGLAAGFGGVATMITVGGVDIINMAAQLYRLNQRVALLNGFDPEDPLESELTREVFLYSLGFDKAATASIQAIMSNAARVAGNPHSAKQPVLKFIILVAKQLGITIGPKKAAQFVPVLGGMIGGGVNYAFAKYAANQIVTRYKEENNKRFRTML